MADQLKSGLNGGIFVDKNTAFIVEKYNPKDLIEKEIGDSKTPDKFIPQQKLIRWDNECNFSVRLIHNEKIPDVVIEGDSVVWRGKKVEAKFYDVFNDEHPEGASEFEIILKEKPATNVVEFTVVDKDVEYFYQPALTPEEIEQGASRPENVEGSYAVYAKTPKTNWVGGKEYKVGKVGHIFRPKIIDSAGKEVWGELHIENGILSVSIPQEFLDKAVYPVRHAAGLTIGNTSNAGTSPTAGNGYAFICKGTPASGGTVESITFQGSVTSGSGNYKGALWFVSDNSLVTNSVSPSVSVTGTGKQNIVSTYITRPTVTTVEYFVGVITSSASNYVYYDTGAAGSGGSAPNDYNTPTSMGTIISDTRVHQVYATYADYNAYPANSHFYLKQGWQ